MSSRSSSDTKQRVVEYFMSLHYGICQGPIDRLNAIIVKDKEAWRGDLTWNTAIKIDQPELFGGPTKEGGIFARVDVRDGSFGQTAPESLAARLGMSIQNMPTYRGVAYALFTGGLQPPSGSANYPVAPEEEFIREVDRSGFTQWITSETKPSSKSKIDAQPGAYWGANMPTIPPVGFNVTRVANKGWFPEVAEIPGIGTNWFTPYGPDSNPAHIVRECLINQTWGMGSTEQSLDDAAFRKAAQTFFDEGFGLSMIWTQQAKIETFIQEVLDHVEATLFVDPATGLFVLRAIRDDYVIPDLEVFNEDNCNVETFQRRSTTETINEINLTWTNPVNEQEETVTIHDLGAIVANGGEIVSDNRNYYGIRNVKLAMKLARRAIAAATAPIVTSEISVNRSAWKQTPGKCIILDFKEFSPDPLVMRVVKINYGKPGESQIRINLTEDIFSFTRPQEEEPPEGYELPEEQPPSKIDGKRYITLNYYLSAQHVASGALAQVEYPEVFPAALAATANAAATSFGFFGRVPNGSNEFLGQRGFSGWGRLGEDWTQQAQTVTPGWTELAAISPPTVGAIGVIGTKDTPEEDLELVYLSGFNGSTWTIYRGVLDTVPKAWPLGTPIWFLTPGTKVADQTFRSAYEDLEYKVIMLTPKGYFPFAEEEWEPYTTNDRVYRPSRPANCSINGVSWAEVNALNATEVLVSWSERNRVMEDAVVLPWTGATVVPEQGQTTKLTIMHPTTRAVIAEVTGITGSSYALQISELNGAEGVVVVRITSERDGLESWQGYEQRVRVTSHYGYGYGYGLDYGGA